MGERTWIMIDVETSGPHYGVHSLTELGACFGSRSRGVVERFEVLVKPIGDAVKASRDSFAAAQERGLPPAEAMKRFAGWCQPHLEAGAKFIARPAAFDWPWIVFYAWTHLGENPFGFKAVCASSWLEARGKRFDVKLPHRAVEDAVIQLEYFFAHG
jgi:hypothetical protein